jgi:hypothetical protein
MSGNRVCVTIGGFSEGRGVEGKVAGREESNGGRYKTGDDFVSSNTGTL